MNKTSALDTITDLSHEFGTPDYVKGGGGNTSVKTGDILWVKPSGTTLSSLKPQSFVPIDRKKLAALYDMNIPADSAEREGRVKQILQDAVLDETAGRPSVETPIHDLLEARFVVHTHPVLVNGMTCSKQGSSVAATWFPEALWIPYTDPGFILSMEVRKRVNAYRDTHGCQPSVIFLENHGVFVSGETPDALRKDYRTILEKLAEIYRQSGVTPDLEDAPVPDAAVAHASLQAGMGRDAACMVSHAPVAVAEGPLTPDHMVYAKAFPLTQPIGDASIRAFEVQHGYKPRVILGKDGMYAVGPNQTKAQLAMDLALDGAQIVQLAEAFGGVQYMDDAAREFIENWEVESYRESVSTNVTAVCSIG